MMSETRPTYVACASGSQLMADCLVRRHGSLIELVGHPIMHFTPGDARRLALTLQGMADAIDVKIADNAHFSAEPAQ